MPPLMAEAPTRAMGLAAEPPPGRGTGLGVEEEEEGMPSGVKLVRRAP